MSAREAAEWYERGAESWLLPDYARLLADAAEVTMGDAVLDVGCGTGIVARECAHRVGQDGSVAGIDISKDRLAVARRIAPHIDWHLGDAMALPFADESFDRVVSQSALMFFPDPESGVAEMWRVLRPHGHLAVGVPGGIPPAYERFAELAVRHLDSEAGEAIESAFVLGNPQKLKRTFSGAGLNAIRLGTVDGVQRFRSPADFVEKWVRATARLADRFDDTSLSVLAKDVAMAIQDYVTGDGVVEVPTCMHVVTSHKPTT